MNEFYFNRAFNIFLKYSSLQTVDVAIIYSSHIFFKLFFAVDDVVVDDVDIFN